jgi:hypothetical protein
MINFSLNRGIIIPILVLMVGFVNTGSLRLCETSECKLEENKYQDIVYIIYEVLFLLFV